MIYRYLLLYFAMMKCYNVHPYLTDTLLDVGEGEGKKLKPSEARAGVRARMPRARARARRVHKLPTKTERAEGEDIDAHRLNRVRVRDFLQSCRAVLPFVV